MTIIFQQLQENKLACCIESSSDNYILQADACKLTECKVTEGGESNTYYKL
jgi:hypothetical protein